MADYGVTAMSLSQGGSGSGGARGRDLSPASDDQHNDSSDQSPRSLPAATTSSKHRRASLSSSSPAATASDPPRKPRGRPPGSKNKPKPPIVITKDSDSAMKPVVLEISAGSDVVESVIQFARRRRVGVTLLSGSGSVSNVTLRHPMSHAPALSLHGPFTLLSLSGSVVAPTSSTSTSATTSSATETTSSSPSSSSSTTPPKPSFGICLAGAQGQVFGGIVGGKVIAASVVLVVATTFVNPSFHRLSGDNIEAEHHHHQHHHSTEGGHHHHDHHHETKPSVVGGNHEAAAAGYPSTGTSSHVVSPTPISCQVSSSDHHVMPGWGHSSRSPY
ncbi:hypothetical protein TIFTF001_012874 [Ficus carica]|uniref:AT-hook motif nuclear-localized protein n=1 Tax=Ficus carica TaxID=3494 RepID=A0AA88AD53_FICCA|nr:hypothetical protein TIFTF001_012874 [Ficus carica]